MKWNETQRKRFWSEYNKSNPDVLRVKNEGWSQGWKRYDEAVALKHSLVSLRLQTHVLLSLGGTKRLMSTKLSFPPRGLQTRMSHLPWGGCFYRPVTSDPFSLQTFKSVCPETEKTGKGNKEDFYCEIQPDSWGLVTEKELFMTMWTQKAVREGLYSTKGL